MKQLEIQVFIEARLLGQILHLQWALPKVNNVVKANIELFFQTKNQILFLSDFLVCS